MSNDNDNDCLLMHTAVYTALMDEPDRRLDGFLWASDLGKNPYHALRRIAAGELEPFDYPTRLKMDNGNALESATLRQLAQNATLPIRTNFPLYNDIWSGYADVVINHGTDNVIIYDHKGSGGRWWDYKSSLPRATDCCQVWLYGQLYRERYGIQPELGIYYRGWGTWAEFRIAIHETNGIHMITALGFVTDDKGERMRRVTRYHPVNPGWLRREIESYYDMVKTGEMTLGEIEALNPNGPDWDYAVDNYDRLQGLFGE